MQIFTQKKESLSELRLSESGGYLLSQMHFLSPIGDAVSPLSLAHALSAALSARLCRAPLPRLPLCARLRLYPAPLMHREDNGAAHSWDITKKVSLKKKIGLSFFERSER